MQGVQSPLCITPKWLLLLRRFRGSPSLLALWVGFWHTVRVSLPEGKGTTAPPIPHFLVPEREKPKQAIGNNTKLTLRHELSINRNRRRVSPYESILGTILCHLWATSSGGRGTQCVTGILVSGDQNSERGLLGRLGQDLLPI